MIGTIGVNGDTGAGGVGAGCRFRRTVIGENRLRISRWSSKKGEPISSVSVTFPGRFTLTGS